MKPIVFISDFFHKFGGPWANGGAELNDNYLIDLAESRGYEVTLMPSADFTADQVNQNNVYVVSNFIMLRDSAKKALIKNGDYVIIEHDHKYVANRDVSIWANNEYVVPKDLLLFQDFYQKAKYVYGFSWLHGRVVGKNVGRDVIPFETSFWTNEEFDIIINNRRNTKDDVCAVLRSNNPIKGTQQAIEVANSNRFALTLIPPLSFPDFVSVLSKCKTLILMPQVLESFSRVAAEACMLGVQVVTNFNVPMWYEKWANYKDTDLINYFMTQRDAMASMFLESLWI